MKKIFYSILAAAAVFTACNREIIENEGHGSLSLDLSCKTDYTEVQTKASQTEEEIINGLSIDIVRPYDGWSITYSPFSDIRGKIVPLGSGSYILTASSPDKKPAAFDQPIFEGSKDFTIKTGEVTSVDVTCTIANVMMTLQLTENFVNELSAYTVTVSNGAGEISWNKNAEVDDFEPAVDNGKTIYKGKKAGYFTVAPLQITVDGFRGIDGTAASTVYVIDDPKAADHHIVTLDAVVTGSLGGINLTVSSEVNRINQSVIVDGLPETGVPEAKPDTGDDSDNGTEDDGNEGEGGGDTGDGGNETPDTPDVPDTPSTAPTLSWPGNPTFADLQLPKSDDAVVDVDLAILAPEGIKTFLIYVKSNVLAPAIADMTAAGKAGMENGVVTMDMINDDVLYGNLGASPEGLPMKDRVLNQTNVPFPLSSLVPLINLLGPEIGDEHIFNLYVVDNKNQVLDKTLKFVSVAAN